MGARDADRKRPRPAQARKASGWVLKSTIRRSSPPQKGLKARPFADLHHVRVVAGSQQHVGLDWGIADAHMVVLHRDGSMTVLKTEDVTGIYTLTTPFQPASPTEVQQQLDRKLPWRFRWSRVGPWLVGSTADRSTLNRLCRLLRRHYAAYARFAQRRGLPLRRPAFPLVILVFDQRQDFETYAGMDGISDISPEFAGYYSLETNRVAFSLRGNNEWHNLSTLLHEATHQLMYNTGFLKRYAHYPKWLLEGLAMYFETPDRSGGIGGARARAGAFNYRRWEVFQKYRADRTEGELLLLVAGDESFSEGPNVLKTYAEAWALTYYLAEKRPRQFQRYLKRMLRRRVLQPYTEAERLADFAACFGHNVDLMDRELCKLMDRLGQQAQREVHGVR